MAGFSKEQRQELGTIIEGHIEKLALQVGAGFNEMGERLSRLETKVDRLEARINGVEYAVSSLENKFELMEQRMGKAEDTLIHHRLKRAQKA